MSCCGQSSGGRLVIKQSDIDAGLRFEVEYWGGLPVKVEGLVTHESYSFSGSSRTGLIDPRDAPAILKNQLFRLKGTKRPEAAE